MSYGIAELVAELKQARASAADEQAMLAAATQAVGKIMADGGWIRPEMRHYDEQTRYGDVLLHEEPDHSLAIFAIAWASGVTTPPHDHATWVVIATAEGEEVNTLWRRRGSGYEPEREVRIGAGEMVALSGSDIHSVTTGGDGVTLSMHVYGMHPDHTPRSKFDPATGEASQYLSTDA